MSHRVYFQLANERGWFRPTRRMTYFLISPLILLLLTAECALSQIGYPSQYPGQRGPYPGGGIPFPIPGRRTRTNQDNQPTQNFIGVVRKLSTSELVIEPDDKRTVTLLLFSSTRYYKSEADADSGNSSRPPGTAKRIDFQPGDQVSVDAAQDNNGNFRAAKVAMVKQSKADDRESPSPTTTSHDSGGDRPKLHRADQPDSGNSSGTQTASAGQNQPAAASDRPSSDRSASDGPVLNRPATTMTPPPPPLDADDAGQPTLQRGTPSRNGSASADSGPAVVADSRPSLHAEDVNGVTRLPDAPQVLESTSAGRGRQYSRNGDEDLIIAQARWSTS